MIKGKVAWAVCRRLGVLGGLKAQSFAVLVSCGDQLIRLEIRSGQSLARIRGKEKPGLTESGFFK